MKKPWRQCTLMRATSISQSMPKAAIHMSRPPTRHSGRSNSVDMTSTTKTAGIPACSPYQTLSFIKVGVGEYAYSLHELPVFSRDWLKNGEEFHSASGRIDARHTARNGASCRAAQGSVLALEL